MQKVCNENGVGVTYKKSCRCRDDGYEVSVFFGRWYVKSDTVYLIFKKEKIYEVYKYRDLQYYRENYLINLRPFPRSVCRFRWKIPYTFQPPYLRRTQDFGIF